MFQQYYIPPVKVSLEDYTYTGRYSSYSEYNYLQPGISSFLKTRHFEYALQMTEGHFNKANVIDFACADGAFLPSLSRYFCNVLAIDKNPALIKLASKVVQEMQLTNVTLICNADLTLDILKSKIQERKYQILYLLETLEHIGDKSSPWDSRVNFLRDLSGLVEENGIIVLTVPNMVGISFLLQRLGLFLLNKEREPISTANIIKASLLNDTTNLESQWDEGHIGFNHQKLEERLKNDFRIVGKRNIIFQVVYILGVH